ncbi:hypothetical protein SAMN05661093_05094 [Kibdelosporangium aridum]|uniref:Uncharacterized protein n=2 Tax=Kibdelosporangium aridum TaxID=2030 RepID=A0A1Y5XS66_KIBAR|nr:hypothetical protein SAMN05661093_05094 [Kibdelosporangium aridum]
MPGLTTRSYSNVSGQAYEGALILFYEQGTIANFRELFLAQLQDAATNYFFPIDDAA